MMPIHRYLNKIIAEVTTPLTGTLTVTVNTGLENAEINSINFFIKRIN